MSCTVNKIPSNEMENFLVIKRLFALHSVFTECSPLPVIVSLPTGTYFNDVWSIFITKADGLSYFSIFDTMSWRYRNSISVRAPSRMSTFDNVFLCLTKFILENRLFAQRKESRSTSQTTQGYYSSELWLLHFLLL